MKLLKNRIFLSIICITIAAVISFVLLPRFYEDKSITVMVLRAAGDIKAGTEITDKHLARKYWSNSKGRQLNLLSASPNYPWFTMHRGIIRLFVLML